MAVRRLVSFFLPVLLIGFSTVAAQRPRTTPRRSPPQYPNVIVITLDTTRADRMGFLGSKRGLTPNLDAMARQGVVFNPCLFARSAYDGFTRHHFYGDLSAVQPCQTILACRSLPSCRTCPNLFHQHGYQTGAFVGSLILDPLTARRQDLIADLTSMMRVFACAAMERIVTNGRAARRSGG